MELRRYGHACVVIEDEDRAGGRVLIDPGNLGAELDRIAAVDAVLVTHEHADHLDLDRVRLLLAAAPELTIHADAGSGAELERAGLAAATSVVQAAEPVRFTAAGWQIEASTVRHEVIHPDLPTPVNNAYLIDGRILHPGDALWRPDREIDVLLLPIGAPWLKLSESIDYLRDVRPRVVIPIHDGGLAEPHRHLHCALLRKLGPAGTEVVVLAADVPFAL